jgi:cysteine-rich secretory family protein
MASRIFARLLFASAILSFVSCAHSFAQSAPTGDEKYLFGAVNHDRTSAGLQPLKWDASLAAAARAHLAQVVEHRRLSHQFSGEADLAARCSGAGARFSMTAENVALAPSIDEMHIGWMNSIPHRENIMNPKLTAIGIAVGKRGDTFFGVQDFSRATDAISREEQEKTVGALLRSQGYKIAAEPDEARALCDKGLKASSGARSVSMLQFETGTLDELPEPVLHSLKKNSFRTAAVGACNTVETKGFLLYRIAILLY